MSNNDSALEVFTGLHQQQEPLLLGNVWDAHSAQLAEAAGFKALGTSSHAIAFALGYEDGENISLDELLFMVKRIVQAASIPVSVDFEAGYSEDPIKVAEHVSRLTELGVVGINIEDGKVVDGKRVLTDKHYLPKIIKAIKARNDIFINARIDTYTTEHAHALEESLERASLYQEAGADGIFVPLIEKEADIQAFVEKISLPLNVFTTPELPDYNKLGALGVKRISHGAKQYDLLMKRSKDIFKEFYNTKDYKTVLG